MEESKKNEEQLDINERYKNVRLMVVTQIAKTHKLPAGINLGLSERHLTRYVKKLKSDGLIYKIGYRVWDLKKSFSETLRLINEEKNPTSSTLLTPNQPYIRGHGYKVTLTIPKIDWWYKREAYLIKNAIAFRTIQQGQTITLEGFKIWLCNKSLVIHTTKGQNFYTHTAKTSLEAFMQTLYNLFLKIEALFKISFKINKTYVFRIFRQHYGKVNDPLAVEITARGEKLEVRNERGAWLIVDRSLNLNELETIHTATAIPDMDKVIVPFFNDLKGHYDRTGETILLTDMVKLWVGYAVNIEAHVQSIKDLSKGVNKWNDSIDLLFEALKQFKK
jgi:hypothetical protein